MYSIHADCGYLCWSSAVCPVFKGLYEALSHMDRLLWCCVIIYSHVHATKGFEAAFCFLSSPLAARNTF